jgi:F420-0:gamma-glutamyl ligase
LSYWGFDAVINMVGTPDLFGRPLRMTRMNMADGLAAAAVMTMGEGREARPLALIENPGVEFTENTDPAEILIPLVENLYYPMLKGLHGPK